MYDCQKSKVTLSFSSFIISIVSTACQENSAKCQFDR